MNSQLVSRNITVNGHRTSIRLEKASWAGLDEICTLEDLSVHELCSLIDVRRTGSSRTSSVRSFIVTYFRMAAAENGFNKSGQTKAVFSQLEAVGN